MQMRDRYLVCVVLRDLVACIMPETMQREKLEPTDDEPGLDEDALAF